MRRVASALMMTALFLASTMAVAVSVHASASRTYTVAPSGGDDTANIQGAFDRCVAAGPGCTVKLTAGVFYSNTIFVQNFNGFFRGAGKDVTVIDTLRGLDPNLPGLTLSQSDPSDPSTLYPYLFFFGFEGGDITVSDMSFDITAFKPAETFVVEDLEANDARNVVRITGNADSAFERVGFRGHDGPIDPSIGIGINTFSAIAVCGREHLDHPGGFTAFIEPMRGVHTVSSCSFEYVEFGVLAGGLMDGTITIGGTPNKKNVFDALCSALIALDSRNSNLEFSYNEVQVKLWAGAYVIQGIGTSYDSSLPALSARVVITHNNIRASGTADGVVLVDLGPFLGMGKTLDAVVADNTVVLDNTQFGGIYIFQAQGIVVFSNRITGTGLAGIYMGVSGDSVAGCVLVGNNVEQVNSWVAPIWLGPGTSDCTVVGGSTKTNVIDEGTENILVGVSSLQGIHLGEQIREAMKQKADLQSVGT